MVFQKHFSQHLYWESQTANTMIMNEIDYRLTQYKLVNKAEVPNRFFENLFPVHVYVIRRIAKAILPENLYMQFLRWQEAKFIEGIRKILSKYTERPVIFHNREVPNNTPKYDEYNIFFQGDPEKDRYVKYVGGFGNSFNSNSEALSKAIGEFLERFALADDWDNDVQIGTPYTFGRKAVSFAKAPLYLKWQKNKVKDVFTLRKELNTACLGWVRGKSLLGLGSKYIPAQRVFWARKRTENENVINQQTSNGNGGGFTYSEAVLSGLYELFERDSFMCYWLMKISPKRIPIDTVITPNIEKLRPFIRRYKLDITFLDITTVLAVPVVACLVIDRSKKENPKITVGAACGYNPIRLFEKSLMEALAAQRHFWYPQKEDIDLSKMNVEGYFADISFDKHDEYARVRMWQGNKMEQEINFFLDGESITYEKFLSHYSFQRFSSPKAEFRFTKKTCSSIVNKYGNSYKPYVYRARHPVLKKVRYHAVGIVVPALYPFYLNEHTATLDVSHMKHWRMMIEQSGRKWMGEVENKYPHPFP